MAFVFHINVVYHNGLTIKQLVLCDISPRNLGRVVLYHSLGDKCNPAHISLN